METKFNWLTGYDLSNGYCLFGVKLMEAVMKKGLTIAPITNEQVSWWSHDLFAAAGIDTNAPTVMVGIPIKAGSKTPHPVFEKFSGRHLLLTMFEATRLPKNWPETLVRYAERVIVPSPFCEHVFKSEIKEVGSHLPVHVVPGGVDPEVYTPAPVQVDRPYTFLALGDRGARKGWDLVWRAFCDEFGESNDVRLLLKSQPHNFDTAKPWFSDYRVSFWRSNAPNMAEVYKAADCFVFPSRGEGFGLPPREAAACGIPVIAAKGTGLDDGTLEEWALPVGGEMRPVPLTSLPTTGNWFEPSLEEVRKQMRWCYENRIEAREFGLRASRWLHANQTWDHAATEFLKVANLRVLPYMP